MRCSDCGGRRNPLEPREPSSGIGEAPIERVKGIYLTDDWKIAANFAMGQSLANYSGTFMKLVYFDEEGNKLKTPLELDTNWVFHPLTKSQSQFYKVIDDLKSLSKGPLGVAARTKDWSKLDYTTFGVLVPLVFEINVDELSLEVDPEVEFGLNTAYHKFRTRISRHPTVEGDTSKKHFTFEEAKELPIDYAWGTGEGFTSYWPKPSEFIRNLFYTINPLFEYPIKALEAIMGEEYARAWYSVPWPARDFIIEDTPLPNKFIKAAGMLYTTEEIPFDRIVSISSSTLPGDLKSASQGYYQYPQLLYQGLPAETTLYHGTTILAALSAFPQLEELLNLPSELKDHWHYLQLRDLIESDLTLWDYWKSPGKSRWPI